MYFDNSAYILMYINSIQDLTHLRPDVPRVCGREYVDAMTGRTGFILIDVNITQLEF